MATDRGRNFALITRLNRANRAWCRVDKREITPSHTSIRELPGERRMHSGRFRDNHNTRCILIEPMNDTWTIGLTYRELFLSDMVNDGVRDSMRVVSRSRVHGDSRRFIENDKVRVLEEDLEGKIERRKMGFLLARNRNLNPSAIAHLHGRFHNDLAIYRDRAILNPPLDLRPTTHQRRRETLNDNLVESRVFSMMLYDVNVSAHRATSP
jgi:hypothetical protein